VPEAEPDATSDPMSGSVSAPMSEATVGIVGAGQLARMTYEAGTRLDVRLRVLARDEDETAARIFSDVAIGSPDDAADLADFASTVTVMTFDHELVDVDAIRALEEDGHVIRPTARTLDVSTNKQRQRDVFSAAGLPLPVHRRVGEPADIEEVAAAHGWPVVLKAAQGGYDGRGVWTVGSVEVAVRTLGEAQDAGLELFVEPRVSLDRELAVLIARRPTGDAVTYPVVETIQVEGICHEVLAPARIDAALAAKATELGLAIAEEIDSVGILAVEMFVVGETLLINEIASRPHNSGHFTLDAARTSQFENHLRAVLDLPLGGTELTAPAAAMSNIIGTASTGDPRERRDQALEIAGVCVHLYGKKPRPGRKIGHTTAFGEDLSEARSRAREAAEILAGGAMGGPR
jgi:5-(carboxyamino)imidazole ribonucleotide synthase